jgi:Family of unknown function (DUF6491)
MFTEGFRKACVSIVGALLGACATNVAQRDQQQLEEFQRYAGPPIEQFTWLGHYYSWQYVGQYKVVVWTAPNDAYLITVLPPCEDLPWAHSIGLTSTQSTVSARFDSVLVRNWKCQISEIRPIDYLRMKQDMRAQHEAPKGQHSQR